MLHCPPHPHPTGVTKVVIHEQLPKGAGVSSSPVLNSNTLFSHPLADFFSVKGNQDHIKTARSNWRVCSAKITRSVSKWDFLEALANDVGENCYGKHAWTYLLNYSITLIPGWIILRSLTIVFSLFCTYKYSTHTHHYKHSVSP